MRRFAALQTCFALAQALFLAPFQHVHADHDHPNVVHAHFYAVFQSSDDSQQPHFDDNDEHSSARSLDTFTFAFAPNVTPCILDRGTVVEPDSLTHHEPIEAIEACAHDPPAAHRSNPRAPPA